MLEHIVIYEFTWINKKLDETYIGKNLNAKVKDDTEIKLIN